MAKEFFKNAGEAFKALFTETVEAGKRFAQSEAVQKVAADVKEKVQEFEASEFGAKVAGTMEKMGDELAHQVKKLYKVCPACGRKMAASDKYCGTCGAKLPEEPVVWDEAETVADSDFADVPAAQE